MAGRLRGLRAASGFVAARTQIIIMIIFALSLDLLLGYTGS